MRLIIIVVFLVDLISLGAARAGSATQPLIVAPGADAGPVLDFKIGNVRHGMAYSAEPPYVRPGGNITFFDCTLTEDPAAMFTVGAERIDSKSDVMAWGRVVVFVPTRDAGAHFAAAFAKAFSTDMPPALSPQPIGPVSMGVAVLGEKLGADLTDAKPGNWTATKWFVSEPGIDAEVFFNYDLVDGQGRFEEKDSDYRSDLAYFMAENFRDGPRRRRSAADDASIRPNGARIQMVGLIPDSKACQAGFIEGGDLIWLSPIGSPGDLRIVSLANLADPVLVGRFGGEVTAFALDTAANRMVVDERDTEAPGTYSSDDKHHLWLIDRAAGKRTELAGEWSPSASIESVSSDGRFIAIDGWQSPRRLRTQIHYFYDTKTGLTAKSPSEGTVTGWSGSGDMTSAFLQKFEIPRKAWTKIAALTGRSEPVDEGALPLQLQTGGSSDGDAVFNIADREFLEFRKADGSLLARFKFHADDRHYAVADSISWLDSRFLLFSSRYPAFIDSRNLTMTYVPDEVIDSTRHEFSRDFRRVWEEKPDGIHVGRVAVSDRP